MSRYAVHTVVFKLDRVLLPAFEMRQPNLKNIYYFRDFSFALVCEKRIISGDESATLHVPSPDLILSCLLFVPFPC